MKIELGETAVSSSNRPVSSQESHFLSSCKHNRNANREGWDLCRVLLTEDLGSLAMQMTNARTT